MKDKSEILFQNESVVAINKPAGILSVPDRYSEDRLSIANWILSDFPDARPLHRLDFETSGILLFSVLPDAFGWYSDQFEKRIITKSYHAITEGRIMQQEGLIDQPLFAQTNGRVVLSKRGKESQTQWNVLERFLNHSYVEVIPLTGRTHQIRVHLSSINHPVVGDNTYGSRGPLFLSSLKGKKNYRLGKDEDSERPLLSRIALHAAGIRFIDFHSKQEVTIDCPLPKDMTVGLQKLRQYTSIHQ